MKLLEFLGVIREDETSGPGKFVGARLTRDTEQKLIQWMRDNGLRKKEPRTRFHVTVIGDKQREFPWNPATFEPPLEADKNSYKLERFGPDGKAVVLTFSVPELEERHRKGREEHGIDWDFPTYQPHLTLSMDPNQLNDLEMLLLPTFSILISHEYEQPFEFNEEDADSERRRKERV